jgi:hypothetical protein
VGHDRVAAVAGLDGHLAEIGLEADQPERHQRAPDDRRSVAMIQERQSRQGQDLEADQDRDGSVDPLDPDLRAVGERRQELALEAAGPMGTGHPRVGGADDHPDRDEQERRHDRRRGEPGVAGQRASSGSVDGDLGRDG